jgi:hypothetical protein
MNKSNHDRTIILTEADLKVCASVDEAFEDDFDTIVSKMDLEG